MIELLLSLILMLTGIPRDVDPGLTAVAEQRVQEIQSDFSHNGMQTAEILAWNSGHATTEDSVRRVAVAWQESPPHWAIMSDPGYTRIGCAMDIDSAGVHWYVCAFAGGTSAPPPPASPGPAPAAPPATDAPLLPDTAMPRG